VKGDPRWYKDAVIYEVHARAFQDSSGDGVGDFRGLASRLDYLKDLGITAIWILPFYPSPLRDDGYDTADYTSVHPSYGTIEDVKHLLREAHARGLRVITELVLNHTSDQHPWFKRARTAPPGSPERDFYVWSDSPEKYREARVIFKDFEPSNWTWDPVARAYYWHRFYSHQPDLNFDNPEVHRALLQAVDFWLGLGIDGLRLDAVPYLYEREGTNCENVPETHEFLRMLRRHVDSKFPDRMLLAEANQWPEDAAAYFGKGDECHMAFHFPIMPRMFMAIHMEDRFPIVDILRQTPAIPEPAQWAVFLRNHDELTLEMVTDEERDYMYRAYSRDAQARINLGIRRRLAPLLGNNRRKIELMNALLFSLPGTPVIYYGDEIGMGDNIFLGDRNGVRTPMQWSADKNAGFSRANPQRLYLPVSIDPEYHYEAVNVEGQLNNPHSLLWWMRRLIALRRRRPAFSRGSVEFLYPSNPKVLAFIRRLGDETILVVANLSRFAQYAELDLPHDRGKVPVELFSRSPFPAVEERPYLLTLGPHSFLWFSLEPAGGTDPDTRARRADLPLLEIPGPWEDVAQGAPREEFERLLPSVLSGRRWFRGKSRSIRAARLAASLRIPHGTSASLLCVVRIEFFDGEPADYVLPLSYAPPDKADLLRQNHPTALLARLAPGDSKEAPGILYDAAADPSFAAALLDLVARRGSLSNADLALSGSPTATLDSRLGPGGAAPEAALLRGEQSNTSILFGDRLILKLYRRPEEGTSLDLEIAGFLTEAVAFPHTPDVAGWLDLRRGEAAPCTLAVVQSFVPNEGDGWRYTLDALEHYFERVLTGPVDLASEGPPAGRLLDLTRLTPPRGVLETVGPFLESARLIGLRTAELHLALGSSPRNEAFAPEPFGALYQRSIYQSMRNLSSRVFDSLRRRRDRLPDAVRPDADRALALEAAVLDRFHALLSLRLDGGRIRIHGDYHLGQLLWTGKDFVIIDFEGEPSRSLAERRLKRSPLRDVAGMIRSFHYAAYAAWFAQRDRAAAPPEKIRALESSALLWYRWVSSAFLRAYLDRSSGSRLLPSGDAELRVFLDLLLLEKAVYELGYELDSRPDWALIPLQGILSLVTPETPP
jgi:maltose alpha-D-glucosyltransferase/alpha-amylase